MLLIIEEEELPVIKALLDFTFSSVFICVNFNRFASPDILGRLGGIY
jgi:hypothetical protein